MPRHFRYYRRRAGLGRPLGTPFARRINNMVWIVGLFILFYTRSWWPGILILIGISMVVSTLAAGIHTAVSAGEIGRDAIPPDQDWNRDWQNSQPRQASNPPAPQPVSQPAPHPVSTPAPQPAQETHYTGWLPANCPNCGAPVRANTVRWTGSQSADCAYCSSPLPGK